MSTNNVINKSRVVLLAFIATLCLALSTMSAISINGANITTNTAQSPAMAAGWQDGSGGS